MEITVDKEDGEYLFMKYNQQERKADYIQKVTVKDKKTKFITKGYIEKLCYRSFQETESQIYDKKSRYVCSRSWIFHYACNDLLPNHFRR